MKSLGFFSNKLKSFSLYNVFTKPIDKKSPDKQCSSGLFDLC